MGLTTFTRQEVKSCRIPEEARFQECKQCANLYAAMRCAYVPMRFVSSFCSRVRTPTGKPTFLVACSARRLHLPRFTATRRRRKSGRPTTGRPSRTLPPKSPREGGLLRIPEVPRSLLRSRAQVQERSLCHMDRSQ